MRRVKLPLEIDYEVEAKMSLGTYFLTLSLLLMGFSSPYLNHKDPFLPKLVTSLQDASPVKIELIPVGGLTPAKGKPYRVGKNNLRLKILVTNNSSGLIKALVIDTYHQNRPKLFKDSKLVPYRKELSSLLAAKDKDPHFIRLGEIVFLQPATTTDLEELNLADWYEHLDLGHYRVVNRHRFELFAPWSVESEELEFDIVADK